MEDIIRAVLLYFCLLVIFRLAGKHALAEITTFDFVLLLIIGEVADQAIMGKNSSLTGAVLVMLTLVSLDQGTAFLKHRYKAFRNLIEGTPVILIKDGKLLRERLDKEMIEESDIMNSARELRGLESLDQVKHAVLETHGGITIIPKRG